MRLIDAEDYLYRERPVGLSDESYKESHSYKSIMEQEVIQAIPLAEIKQAREEIENIDMGSYLEVTKEMGCNDKEVRMSKKFATAILDKLIAESEEKK